VRRSGGSASAEQLAEIERAAVRSWPALETADIEGWLWRYASGGSLRANSVAALAFTGRDPDAAIAAVERLYAAKGAPCRFTVSEASAPADLDALLAVRGYERGEDHVTMAKDIAGSTVQLPAGVTVMREPTSDWLDIYLAGLSGDRRAVAPRLLAGLRPQHSYFGCSRSGRLVSSGLSVVNGPLASVQCMATQHAARRQGGARAVLRAIEAHARHAGCRHLYLQAEAANTAALSLYQAFGFRVAGRYHMRSKR
jgi:ribosomal protein S18 acetylase RimI-like enzyme